MALRYSNRCVVQVDLLYDFRKPERLAVVDLVIVRVGLSNVFNTGVAIIGRKVGLARQVRAHARL